MLSAPTPARSVLFCGDKTRATSAAAAQGYRSFRAKSVRHFALAPRPMELLLDLPRFTFDRSHPPGISPPRPGHQGSESLCHSLSLPSGIQSLHNRSSRSREVSGSAPPRGGGLREIIPTENGPDRRSVAALPSTSSVPIPADIDGTIPEKSSHQECNISAPHPASRVR